MEVALANPITCLWGPPGTGKTHAIVEIIKQLQAGSQNRQIMVTALAHNAVDNVMAEDLSKMTTDNRRPQKSTSFNSASINRSWDSCRRPEEVDL
ncbi:hypothetical protein BJ878DRAFT_503602 [Calycina marina]|uniref:DNA2/NAM7 helicase helicase domain-containing protein n=1 Tax=Calycina marina TaxID=1763456 RepID=A0A9P8CFM4_9HELO|nr:hypothetical protein BJ878DRAFT_503602 [Calycina marina]